jgi:hypothetical protein
LVRFSLLFSFQRSNVAVRLLLSGRTAFRPYSRVGVNSIFTFEVIFFDNQTETGQPDVPRETHQHSVCEVQRQKRYSTKSPTVGDMQSRDNMISPRL